MIRTMSWCLLLLAATAAMADDLKSEPKKPVAALIGKWQAVSGRFNGADLPETTVKKRSLEFSDKEFTAFEDGKKGRTVAFTLDDSKDPMQIDLTLPNTDQKALGLYKIVDKKLHICYGEPGADRPEKIESEAGSKVFLLVLERVKE